MPGTSDIQTAITRLVADSLILHDIAHGGTGVTVTTEGGPVPSAAKAIADIAAAITVGFAAGFVMVAANSTARAGATPVQAYQLLIQADTKALYYAPTTVMGSWVLHPVQSALAAADAATAAVAEFAETLEELMAASDYVGGSATGVVRTAELLKPIVDFITGNPNSAPNVAIVEDGNVTVAPILSNNRGVDLVDGVDNRSTISNTSRRCQGLGSNFAFVNSPRRLVSWGSQGVTGFGILGSGITEVQSHHARCTIAKQQNDRELLGFDPFGLYTTGGQIEEVISQGAATVARTADGIVLVAGAVSSGVRALFGSGVDKTQSLLMPIYFEHSGSNVSITMMDVQDSVTNNNCAGIYVGDEGSVFLLTNNPQNAAYGNALSGAQNLPVRLNAGFAAWSGKVVQKVRCDATGNIFVLFTDGDLYAGGGSNATGLLGTGGTSNLSNPLQVATDVDDFEVSGQGNGSTTALWLMQGTTLKGAGYNANGQLGQSSGPTANKSSFVTVATNVAAVYMGGTDNVTVMYRDADDVWHGLGRNSSGIFGQGTTGAVNNDAVTLSNLTLLLEDNGGFVDLVISGYVGKHSACVICGNGKAFATGDNTDGCLGNGTLTARDMWTEVRWSPRDALEKIVNVSSAVGPNAGPAFTWLTNQGRILMAGSSKHGFSTGYAPNTVYNTLLASPVQLGNL